ncbi:hypothetical protein BJ741DRAFT_586675 [Chytriomyces cf. hyalinus JEL632]|nr:hypothetical protein BJ741DRAFT_586675 [Chytriomyces cf. hyalinus JEL632]
MQTTRETVAIPELKFVAHSASNSTPSLTRQFSRTSLSSLPQEIIARILLHIPIDGFLRDVAMSSRVFSALLLSDKHFAHKHATSHISSPDFHKAICPDLRHLPLNYVIGLFQSMLETAHEFNVDADPLFRLFYMTKAICNKIVAGISKVLGKDAIARLLDCIRYWHNSREASLAIITDHPHVPITMNVMYAAVDRGWTEFARISMSRGFDVTQADYAVLDHVVRKEDKEMLDILMANIRKQPIFEDKALVFLISDEPQMFDSFIKADSLVTGRPISNGEFVKAIFHGNIERVAEHLATPDLDFDGWENMHLTYAVRFNKPEVLAIILEDPRITPSTIKLVFMLSDAIRMKHWDVYRVVLASTHVQNLQLNNWVSVASVLCEAENLDAVLELLTHDQAQQYSKDALFWNSLLRSACDSGTVKLISYILALEDSGIHAIEADAVEEVIFRLMRGPSDKYMETFNLLAADKRFSPFAVENAENFVYNPTDFSASPLAQIVRTNNNFLSHGFVQGLTDMALREETKSLVRMLIFYHGAQWDPAQLQSFKILFQLDPNITNADMMTSLLSHQTLREALYAEDLAQAAEILHNESSHLYFHQIEQVFEEVGTRGPVTSWVFLLKHILSPDFQKSNSHLVSECYQLLHTAHEVPNDPNALSIESVTKLLTWVTARKLKSITGFLVSGTLKSIYKQPSSYYALCKVVTVDGWMMHVPEHRCNYRYRPKFSIEED